VWGGAQVRTEALVNNVWAAAVQVGQVDKAEKALLKLIVMHPQYPLLLFNLGVALASQGRLQEAKQAYRRCSKRHALPQCAANLANILLQQGHLDHALHVCHTAIATHPRYAPLHSALAAVRTRRGEFGKGLAAALAAVALQPGL
jgi:predicted Zn-dependent protease